MTRVKVKTYLDEGGMWQLVSTGPGLTLRRFSPAARDGLTWTDGLRRSVHKHGDVNNNSKVEENMVFHVVKLLNVVK